MTPWEKTARTLLALSARTLLREDLTPADAPERCELTPEVEAKTDEWIRKWIANWKLKVPEELRYPVLQRARYAGGFAEMSARLGLPPLPGEEDAVLDLLLIEMWHRQLRQMYEKDGDSFSA